MAKWFCLLVMLVFISCGGKKNSLSGDAPVDAKDFVAAFPDMKLPSTVYDTSLLRIGDTTTISRAVLGQFIPDSALQLIAGADKKTIIKPVGKIKRDDETYLLAKLYQNKKAQLAVFVLGKNNKFLNSKSLVSNGNNDEYTHSVSINKEPTFTISREKITKDNQMLYTRTGYAFNKDGGFMVVLNDGNENTKRQDSIINPIDTFARKNPFSGDYIKDKKNFISLRDGKKPNNYLFFVHFVKSDGACTGEIKGEMVMKDEKTAQYTSNGDPCVINFKFSGNQIQMKEEGSCGNHRGIKCFFEDTYTRKKEVKAKTRKK
jgi:hypothetical protein